MSGDDLERRHADGDPSALLDALLVCDDWGEMPTWAQEAIIEQALANLKAAAAGPGARGRQAQWMTRFKDGLVDLLRYAAVLECEEKGATKIDRFDAAAKMLEGSGAGGPEDTIRHSFDRVHKDLQAGLVRYRLPAFFHKSLAVFPEILNREFRERIGREGVPPVEPARAIRATEVLAPRRTPTK